MKRISLLRRNKRFTIVVVILMFIALVGIVAGSIFLLHRYQYRDMGKYYIPNQYQTIRLPAYLHYVSKTWAETDDPSLQSSWEYTYSVASTIPLDHIANDLLAKLNQQGYREVGSTDIVSGSYYIYTESRMLTVTVDIGQCFPQDVTPCSTTQPGTLVIIDASLPL